MSSDNEKSFKVSDRRIFSKEEEPGEKADAAKSKEPVAAGDAPQQEAEKETPSPPIDFSSFILSLGTSILIHLGEVPDPVSGLKETHTEMAKQTIDILDILKKKTEGNLTDQEGRILDSLLADLRMRYLKASKFIS